MALRSSGTDAQFLRNMQKNTSIYKPYEKNTKFYTSKKEKDEHGWGIESVKQIVRKYNGEIDFKYDKDFFEVEIIISDNT